jgi:hypothetical protein
VDNVAFSKGLVQFRGKWFFSAPTKIFRHVEKQISNLPQRVAEDLSQMMDMDWSQGTSVGDVLKDVNQNYSFTFVTRNRVPKLKTASSEREISRAMFTCFSKLCRDLGPKKSRN